MANDTDKVVSTQESILQAIEIVERKLLSQLEFDITETAKIIDDTQKEQGIYQVESASGTSIYQAFSFNATYSNGQIVYVTIPKGDYSAEKIIIGKKVEENETPQMEVSPFDDLVEMAVNENFGVAVPLQDSEEEFGILANYRTESDLSIQTIYNDLLQILQKESAGEELAKYYNGYLKDKIPQGKISLLIISKKISDIIKKDETTESFILSEEEIKTELNALLNSVNFQIKGYTRFGIRAEFKSLLQAAVKGNYGLRVHLYEVQPDITSENGTKTYIDRYETLDVSKMFGNPYNFPGFFSQEYVWNIEGLNTIEFIELELYQENDFFDKDGEELPYQEEFGEKAILPENIFVKNIQIAMGYDVSEFNNEFVQIYSFDNDTYLTKDNEKEIKLRWVHIDPEFGALDIADAAQMPTAASQSDDEASAADSQPLTKEEALVNIKSNSKIEWFRYKLGASSATSYSGVYWERLENDDNFSYILEPDINLANEQIKVVITYPKDSNNHYYSNVLNFDNEKDVSGASAGKFLSALTLKCDDDSYGNYFIYDLGRGLLDSSQSKVIKTITAHFDLEKTGDEIDSVLTEAESICWTVPADATMITPVDDGVDGMTYLSLNEDRGTTFEIDKNDSTIRKEYKNNASGANELCLVIKTTDNKEEWYTGEINEQSEPFRTLIINEDGSAEGEEVRDNYRLIINFSSYVYDSKNKLKSSQPKYTIYEKDDALYKKPLRIYDKINKQISICNYDLNSNNPPIENQLQYRINSLYSPSYNNNTVQCSIVKDGFKYSTSKELSFGIMGTADTDYTLVLDFDDNKHAIVIKENSKTENDQTITFYEQDGAYSCTLRLYDQSGKEVKDFTSDRNVIWSLYSGTLGSSNDLEFMTGNLDTASNQWIAKNKMEIKLGSNALVSKSTSIIIIQASVNWGDRILIAYLPIPLTNSNEYDYINGPDVITYLSDGSINFQNQPYEIITTTGEKIKASSCSLQITPVTTQGHVFVPGKTYYKKDSNNYLESTNTQTYNSNLQYVKFEPVETIDDNQNLYIQQKVSDEMYYIQDIGYRDGVPYFSDMGYQPFSPELKDFLIYDWYKKDSRGVEQIVSKLKDIPTDDFYYIKGTSNNYIPFQQRFKELVIQNIKFDEILKFGDKDILFNSDQDYYIKQRVDLFTYQPNTYYYLEEDDGSLVLDSNETQTDARIYYTLISALNWQEGDTVLYKNQSNFKLEELSILTYQPNTYYKQKKSASYEISKNFIYNEEYYIKVDDEYNEINIFNGKYLPDKFYSFAYDLLNSDVRNAQNLIIGFEECKLSETFYKPSLYYIKDELTYWLDDSKNFDASKTYYKIIYNSWEKSVADVTEEDYKTNVYYYKDQSNNYILDSAEEFSKEKIYYNLNDYYKEVSKNNYIEITDNFKYEKGLYYYKDNETGEYYLDNSDDQVENRKYYALEIKKGYTVDTTEQTSFIVYQLANKGTLNPYPFNILENYYIDKELLQRVYPFSDSSYYIKTNYEKDNFELTSNTQLKNVTYYRIDSYSKIFKFNSMENGYNPEIPDSDSINYDQLYTISYPEELTKNYFQIIKNSENEFYLNIPNLYIENLSNIGIHLTQNIYDENDNSKVIKEYWWTNPILVLMGRYPSRAINKWNGTTVQIDDNNIMANFIGAGIKNNQGQLSGVLLGQMNSKSDSSELTNSETGIYGFSNGEMSYAFKDDGTAFIGKAGKGRIIFDGNASTIQSGNWEVESGKGMKIDLDDGNILINTTDERFPLNINDTFTVSREGKMVAKGVDIRGTVTATSGTFSGVTIKSGRIGGWDIGSGSLSGSGTIYGGEIVGSKISFPATDSSSGIFITHPYEENDTLLKFAYQPKVIENGATKVEEHMYFGQVNEHNVTLKFEFATIDFSDCDTIKGLGVVPVFG